MNPRRPAQWCGTLRTPIPISLSCTHARAGREVWLLEPTVPDAAVLCKLWVDMPGIKHYIIRKQYLCRPYMRWILYETRFCCPRILYFCLQFILEQSIQVVQVVLVFKFASFAYCMYTLRAWEIRRTKSKFLTIWRLIKYPPKRR